MYPTTITPEEAGYGFGLGRVPNPSVGYSLGATKQGAAPPVEAVVKVLDHGLVIAKTAGGGLVRYVVQDETGNTVEGPFGSLNDLSEAYPSG